MGVAVATAVLSVASMFALAAAPASAAAVAPNPVTNVTAALAPDTASITVNFTPAPTGEPATGFVINFIPYPVVYDVHGVAVGLIQVTTTTHPYVWKGGAAGTTYQVNVVATNAYGSSAEAIGPHVGPLVAVPVPCAPAGSPACTPVGTNPERVFAAGDWNSVIKRDYWDFAARKPKLDELTFWRYYITHNDTPTTNADLEANRLLFVSWLAENAEQLDGPAFRLYTAYFARTPDIGGFKHWSNSLNGGAKLIDISNYFATSSEFKTTYGNVDDAEFVAIIYANVLDRTPDGSGFSFWTRQLQIGRYSRAQVMIGFSESQEYKTRQHVQVATGIAYAHMLNRMPTQGEYFLGDTGGYGFPTSPVLGEFGNLYYRVIDGTDYRTRGIEPYAAGGWLNLAAANNPPFT